MLTDERFLRKVFFREKLFLLSFDLEKDEKSKEESHEVEFPDFIKKELHLLESKRTNQLKRAISNLKKKAIVKEQSFKFALTEHSAIVLAGHFFLIFKEDPSNPKIIDLKKMFEW